MRNAVFHVLMETDEETDEEADQETTVDSETPVAPEDCSDASSAVDGTRHTVDTSDVGGERKRDIQDLQQARDSLARQVKT